MSHAGNGKNTLDVFSTPSAAITEGIEIIG